MLLLWPWRRKRDLIASLKPLSAEWSPVNVVSKEYVER